MYNGQYLLKLNGNVFPNAWIQFDSYKVTPNTRLDLDSTLSTADGRLKRTVLPHRRSKIEFNIPPMTDDKYEQVVSFFHANFNNEAERKVTLEYYSFDTGGYQTGEFYMPDWTAHTHMIKANNRLLMNATRFAFIEY